MSDDPQRRAPPIKRPPSPVAAPPAPAEPPAPPAAVVGEGATKTFTIKMESWLTDLAVDPNAPVPVDEHGVPLETYPLDPFVPPPRGPTPVPLLDAAPYVHESQGQTPARPAPPAGTPPAVHYYPESMDPAVYDASSPLAAPLPPASPSPPARPVASAVPPIPALAASAVPPIPGLGAGELRFDEPRRSGPSLPAVLAAVVAVLVGAGVAAWLLWGERIRALLKI